MGFHLWELDDDGEELRLRYLIHEDLRGKVHCLTKVFPFHQGSFLDILRLPFKQQPVSSLKCKMDNTISRYIAQQLYYRSPKWLSLQAEAYTKGENLLNKTATDWYPQIRLPRSSIGFVQLSQGLEEVYRSFDIFYSGQRNRSMQILYPPKKYKF